MKNKYEGTLAERKRQAAQAWKANNPEADQATTMRNWRKDRPCANILHQLKGRKHRTKTSGSEACDLTLADVEALCAPMVCSVTGVPLRWTNIPWDPWRPSIDRIDSDRGYVHGNVRLVCTMYNLSKHRWTDEDVLFMARSLVAQN